MFLHREVMELAAAIPPRGLANRDAAKLLLKDAVRPWLPDALLDRRKQGFALPLPQWLREKSELSGTMQQRAAESPIDELIDPRELARLQAAHATGGRDATGILHAVFVLDQWFARWGASSRPSVDDREHRTRRSASPSR